MNLSLRKTLFLAVFGVLTCLLVGVSSARADVVYQLDDNTAQERFNNSETDETEDNWVANAFQVVAGGTRLLSIDLGLGENFNNNPVTVAIYMGTSVTDPSGLVRIATTDTTLTGAQGTLGNILLAAPVDLNEGDIFFAAVLLRNVPGTAFPFLNNTVNPHGQSFFDVGPQQGAPYDLDMTDNVVVLGATHSVVGANVQSPGNLILRVNATDTP
jgi:hypothetical protein